MDERNRGILPPEPETASDGGSPVLTASPLPPPTAPSTTPLEPITAEEVVKEYAPRVFHVARRMVPCEADAEDVTQDVLLQVVRKLPTFRQEAALPTWLHRVTVNAALMHRRKRATADARRCKDPLDLILDGDGTSIPGIRYSVGPEEAALDRETRELLDRAITRLPDGYRDVLVLADLDGLPNAEVAERLGLRLPAVKSRLHRARHMLRTALASHFEDISA